MNSRLTILLLSVGVNCYSQLPQYLWSTAINGSGDEIVHVVHTDHQGNIYFAGESKGSVDLDPGTAVTLAVPTSTNEILFVCKLNPLGQFVWARWLDVSDGDITSVCTDYGGNLYVAGRFTGATDFDPSPSAITLSSSVGMFRDFIWKLDLQGNLVFAGSLGEGVVASGPVIRFDGLQNIYATLCFSGSRDIDPTTGVYTVSSASSLGNACLMKFDLNLNLLWAGSFMSSGYSGISDFAFDGFKNVVLNLFLDGSATVDINPGSANTQYAPTGFGDQLVLKVASNGNLVWHSEFLPLQAGSRILLDEIELDTANDIFLTGSVNGTVDISPGSGTFQLSSGSLSQYIKVIMRLDQTGSFISHDTLAFLPRDMTIDRDTLIIAGNFSGTVDFDPSTSVNVATSVGGNDCFILGMTGTFQTVWLHAFGGVGNDDIDGVVVSNNHDLYVCGYFYGTTDLDPGISVSSFASQAGSDGYVSKFSPCQDLPLNLSGHMICPGQSASLVATGASKVSWFQNFSGGPALGSGSVFVTPPLNTGTYTFYASTETCSLMPRSAFVAYVQSSPTVSISGATQTICAGTSLTLTVTGADSYIWNNGSGSSSMTVSPASTTVFTVTGTSSVTGCSDTAVATVSVDACEGVNRNHSPGMNVYPNPSRGIVTIQSALPANIEVVDVVGKVIVNIPILLGSTIIDLTDLARGVYY